jgi:hypothetical protein
LQEGQYKGYDKEQREQRARQWLCGTSGTHK